MNMPGDNMLTQSIKKSEKKKGRRLRRLLVLYVLLGSIVFVMCTNFWMPNMQKEDEQWSPRSQTTSREIITTRKKQIESSNTTQTPTTTATRTHSPLLPKPTNDHGNNTPNNNTSTYVNYRSNTHADTPSVSRPPVVKIAHVVALARCTKSGKRLDLTMYWDAMLVLRHSIHQNSIFTNRSKYSYQMYALLHQDEGCSRYEPKVQRLGYIPLVRPTPVNISQINNTFYRNRVVRDHNIMKEPLYYITTITTYVK
jgi:hypothetical protein